MDELLAQYGMKLIAGAGVLLFLLIVVAVMRSRARSKKRVDEIRQWAFRNGFEFIEGPMPGRSLADTKLMTGADASTITRSGRVTLFDLRQTSGTGADSSTRVGSAALFQMEHSLPAFQFMAATAQGSDSLQGQMIGKLMAGAKALAAERGESNKGILMFENRPGFFVHTDDMERTKRIFSDDRLSFFDDKVGWSIAADGSWLIASKIELVAAEHYDELLHTAQSIHDHFFHSSS